MTRLELKQFGYYDPLSSSLAERAGAESAFIASLYAKMEEYNKQNSQLDLEIRGSLRHRTPSDLAKQAQASQKKAQLNAKIDQLTYEIEKAKEEKIISNLQKDQDYYSETFQFLPADKQTTITKIKQQLQVQANYQKYVDSVTSGGASPTTVSTVQTPAPAVTTSPTSYLPLAVVGIIVIVILLFLRRRK